MDLVKNYIDCIENAIENSNKKNTKLTQDVLTLEGYCGICNRIFYNELLNNILKFNIICNYLEIGVWKGSSFTSAIFNNDKVNAIAIDNWSEFNGDVVTFKNNLKNFANIDINDKNSSINFIDGDCFDTKNIEEIKKKGPFNIYMYDGNHDKINHQRAIEEYLDCVTDVFIYLCDDWWWEHIREGTHEAIKNKNLKVLFFKEIYSNNNNYEGWWNGLGIFVLQK